MKIREVNEDKKQFIAILKKELCMCLKMVM